MNKRFVKNNIGLLVVVSVCAAIAAGLLIFTLVQYVLMYERISKIEKLRKEIDKISNQKPAPVAGNRPRLEHNIKLYKDITKQLQAHFGHPMKPAVDAFIAVLRTKKNAFGEDTPDQLTTEQFLEEFHKCWDGAEQRDYANKQFRLNEFRLKFKNWNDAQRAFIKAATTPESPPESPSKARPLTFEELNSDNADEVLLSALGVPRYLDGDIKRLRRVLGGIRERLLKDIGDTLQLSTAAMGLGLIPTGVRDGEEGSSMQEFKVDDFPVVLEHAEIVCDLLARIKGTGIRTIYDVRIRRGESGGGEGGEGGNKNGGFQEGIENAGGYRIYHYQFEVSGSMEAIRDMVAKLDNAFDDRRVYIVKTIFLYAEENGAADIFDIGEKKNDGEEQESADKRTEKKSPMRRRRARQEDDGDDGGAQSNQDLELRRRMEEARRRYREEQERLPFERRDGYGEVLIGSGDTYRAVIDIEYVAQAGR